MIKRYLKKMFGLESLIHYKASVDFRMGTTEEKRELPLIVTLTSIPKRFDTLAIVIETLLSQSLKPDRIILWLSRTDRKGNNLISSVEELPWQLRKQLKRGLEIEFCDDWRSYRKLLPSMLVNPRALHVTADDDTLYPQNWLERLYSTYQEHTDCIICYRGVEIKFVGQELLPYKEWAEFSKANTPSLLLFPQGGEGTLYPPNCFSNDAFDSVTFLTICETADDVWFKAMSLMTKTKCVKVDEFHHDFRRVSSTQEGDSTLHYVNNICGQNDIQINSVFKRFGIDPTYFD